MKSLDGRLPVLRAVLLLCVLSLVTFGAAAQPARRVAPGDIPNEYIVGLRGVPQAEVEAVARELAGKAGGTVVDVWKSAVTGCRIRVADERAHLLLFDQRVATVAQNSRIHDSGKQQTGRSAACTTNCVQPAPGGRYPEPFQPHPLWHLARIGNRTRPAYEYAYCNAGRPQENGNRSVVVYIIDSGLMRFHQEHSPNATTADGDHVYEYESPNVLEVPGSNIVHTNGGPDHLPSTVSHFDCTAPPLWSPTIGGFRWWSPLPWYSLALGGGGGGANVDHGNACASVLGGRNVGVAKDVQIIPVKVMGCGVWATTANLIAGFEWVKEQEEEYATRTGSRRAAVVSVSAFRSVCLDPAQCGGLISIPDAEQLEEATRSLTGYGIPVIASANNQSGDACRDVPGRMSRRGGRGDVITVGGLAKADDRLWTETIIDPLTNLPRQAGSNFGPCVDIMAPAQDIPVASSEGWSSYRTTTSSGTSFSAPMVAGIVARLIAEDASLAAGLAAGNDSASAAANAAVTKAITDRLLDSATRLANPAPLGDNSPNRIAYAGAFSLKTQPRSVNLPQPGSVTLSVESAVVQPTSYVWYEVQNGGDYSSATPVGSGSTLPVTITEAARRRWFWVRVYGPCPATSDSGMYVDSTIAAVSTGCAVIKTQPQSAWSNDATALSIELEEGASPVTITWYRGVRGDLSRSTPVGTGLSLPLTGPILGSDPNPTFWARIAGSGACVVDSDVAQIRGCVQPQITALNTPGPVVNPEPVTVGVTALNATTYILLLIDGAGHATEIRQSTDPNFGIFVERTTTYRIRAQNECGWADSDPFTVTVTGCTGFAPLLRYDLDVSQPAVYENEPTTIRSTTTNILQTDFLWSSREHGVATATPIGGSTAPTIVVAPARTTYYSAQLRSCTNTGTSEEVVVLVRPRITQHPVDRTVFEGSEIELTANGVDLSGLPVGLQWYQFDGTNRDP